MSRREVFDAIKAARGKGYSPAEVALVDALLDQLGVARGTPDGAIAVADALTREFEGCKLTAYPDPGSGGDPWTIGWGATGVGIQKGVVWTQAQADARHFEDLERFAAGVNKLIGSAATTDRQRGAMISLAYNIGLQAFSGSTLLRKHKSGDYAGAAEEFTKWTRAAGRVMTGLVRRREAEKAIYRG